MCPNGRPPYPITYNHGRSRASSSGRSGKKRVHWPLRYLDTLLLIYDGKPVFFKNWIKSNFQYVIDLFTDNGFKSLNKISDEVFNQANLTYEY